MAYRPTRRASALLIAGAALLAAVLSAKADWRDQYKELSFGVSSSENQRDAVARYEPFAAYLTKKLGVPVHILWGTDYAAIIQAMNSSKIQFAKIGSANYALGHKVMGDKIAPVGTDQQTDGSTGYYSVVVVRADSPYQKLEDLKGKVLAWADPNSTSGYAVPLYFMKKNGIDPATFFSKTPFSGSHELGVIGVVNGTFDAAADDLVSDTRSNVTRMEEKGMIGKGLTRNIWKSGLIPNGPYVMRTDLPAELQSAFHDALLSLAKEEPQTYVALGLGDVKQIVPVTNADYADVIAITEANDAERRQH
jgi:phosphonate transport system substrate-binding protein